MTCEYDFVEDDNGILKVPCLDNAGAAINLTGATVTINWMDDNGNITTKTMTVTDQPNGLAEYKFGTGELVAPSMMVEVKIVDAASNELRNTCLLELKIRRKIA